MEEKKEYGWHFAEYTGGREDGPNDPMSQPFKKTPYASLVRESIQNSLDVPLDKGKPVSVRFRIRRIAKSDYGTFFDITKHIKGCLDYFSNQKSAKQMYRPMLEYLNGLGQNSNLWYIQVSDYNTTGMKYVKDDNTNSFYSFVRSAGVSSKNDVRAGGSYGFGKAAYFYISPIRTVLVSTMTDNGGCFFEGVSSLCTHTLDGDNRKYVSVGYFDNNDGEPVSEIKQIPARFQRNEPGTDICIMGIKADKVEEKQEIYNEMNEAVLRNFWLAIYEQKLVVTINGKEINKDNIRAEMEAVFSDEDDTTTKGTIYIPRPYFKAVADCETDKHCVKIERELPILGHVVLYAYKKKKATDKVIYMRAPRMYVFSQKTNSSFGFYGVFVCDSEKGNVILRSMENAAHDEWSAANCADDGTRKIGRKAKNELKEFISSVIGELFPSGQANVQEIQGLKDFLFIYTADEADDSYDAEALTGEATGTKDEEGSSVTTDTQDEVSKGDEITGKGKKPEGQVVVNNDGEKTRHSRDRRGTYVAGNGDGKRRSGDGGTSTKHGHSRYSDDSEGVEGETKKLIEVSFRSFSQTVDGQTVHKLVINSDEEIENAEIEIFVESEQSMQSLSISKCSSGEIEGNSIKGLHLLKGKNTLEIMFYDNMRYALTISAYENI